MTCMEFETLQKIIAEVLDVEEDEITMDTRLLEDLGADSLDAVEIIMGIEDELGNYSSSGRARKQKSGNRWRCVRIN